MPYKKSWENSTSALCEVDAENMMRALGALHSGHVGLMFSPLGIGSSGGVLVTALMTFDVLPGSSLPAAVVAEGPYPCKECKTFWGHVYSVLHGLDEEIGRTYKQESLWQ